MMYVEFIGRVGVPIVEAMAPNILLDPDIEIIEIRQMGPITKNRLVPNGYVCLLHVFVSDEDASYLSLKYPKELSYIFTKV